MKPPILCIFLLSLILCQAQETYVTRTGTISFNASTPLEDIRARNNQVNAIYKVEGQRIGVVLLMRDFEFPNKLMQEHFNENYIHSTQFPKATFLGFIKGLEGDKEQATISGKLTIHGVTRDVSLPATVSNASSGLQLTLKFSLRPEDFDIKIPKIVFKKIAEEVSVNAELRLLPE